jgi:hypothetical protein
MSAHSPESEAPLSGTIQLQNSAFGESRAWKRISKCLMKRWLAPGLIVIGWVPVFAVAKLADVFAGADGSGIGVRRYLF